MNPDEQRPATAPRRTVRPGTGRSPTGALAALLLAAGATLSLAACATGAGRAADEASPSTAAGAPGDGELRRVAREAMRGKGNVQVQLVTVADELKPDEQKDFFNQIQINCHSIGIAFSYKLEEPSSVHARHIVTDHGWKITLDRGLDVFQHYDSRDAFSFATRLQEHRKCKPFEVTYIRMDT